MCQGLHSALSKFGPKDGVEPSQSWLIFAVLGAVATIVAELHIVLFAPSVSIEVGRACALGLLVLAGVAEYQLCAVRFTDPGVRRKPSSAARPVFRVCCPQQHSGGLQPHSALPIGTFKAQPTLLRMPPAIHVDSTLQG